MCVCVSVRERQWVASEFVLLCVYAWVLIVHVHVSCGNAMYGDGCVSGILYESCGGGSVWSVCLSPYLIECPL